MQRKHCFAAFVILLAALPSFGQATLDHYKFWKVHPVAEVRPVSLLGQFDGGNWWSASVLEAQFIGNPTYKNHAGKETVITNAALHYVAYSIRPAQRQTQRDVYLVNQFTGAQEVRWVISRPALLLLPAGKSHDAKAAEPDRGDHFVCYTVDVAEAVAVQLRLEDQFDKRLRSVEQIQRLKPAYFCVPVQKRIVGGVPAELQDPRTHLALYSILPGDRLRRRAFDVVTADQFGELRLRVLESVLLGVPTTKNNWRVR